MLPPVPHCFAQKMVAADSSQDISNCLPYCNMSPQKMVSFLCTLYFCCGNDESKVALAQVFSNERVEVILPLFCVPYGVFHLGGMQECFITVLFVIAHKYIIKN